MALRGILRRFLFEARGSALLEGAVLTPVLMIVVLGVYEYSFVYYQQQLIAAGVRDAARFVSRSVNSAGDPCASAVWTSAKNLATTGVISGGSARVAGWTSANVSIACTSVTNANSFLGGFNGNIYIVTVSTAFTVPTFGTMGFLGQSAPSISLNHQERMIGPG